MTAPTVSQLLEDALGVTAVAAVGLGALDLLLSASRSSSDSFRSAVRHSDSAAATELATVAASILKLLADETPAAPVTSCKKCRSINVYGMDDGRPVVT
jgi:hypothetical protein